MDADNYRGEVIMNGIRLDTANITKIVLRGFFPVLFALAVGCAGTISLKDINPEEDSLVVGRVKDRVIYTAGELEDMGYRSDGWKIDEFELRNASSGKAYKVRMNSDGYFVQKLDQGDFVFELNMSGGSYLKSSRDRGGIRLKDCNIPTKSIVNIGTFVVVSNKQKGMPLNSISFRVIPDNSSESFSDPLAWFKVKNPDVAEAYDERIVSLD